MSFFQPLTKTQAGAIIDVTDATVVRALKDRVNPSVLALDAQVAACPALDPAMRTAYLAFSAGWKAYFASDDSGFLGFGTASIFDTGKAFEAQAISWQQTLNAHCTPNAPTIIPEAPQSDQAKSGITTLQIFGVAALAVGAGVVLIGLRR